MKQALWLLALAAIGLIGYAAWTWRRTWRARKRAAEERFAGFLAQARPAVQPATAQPATAPPKIDPGLTQQKLLLEAASRAGDAGEPALSIQLYARLLARYPESAFGAQARAAVEAQKQKLAKR